MHFVMRGDTSFKVSDSSDPFCQSNCTFTFDVQSDVVTKVFWALVTLVAGFVSRLVNINIISPYIGFDACLVNNIISPYISPQHGKGGGGEYVCTLFPYFVQSVSLLCTY